MALLIIVMVSFTGYRFIETLEWIDDGEQTGESDVEWEEPTIISELGPSMEPVGYFDDTSLFDAEDISSEEWHSHVVYTMTEEETPSSSPHTQFPNRDAAFSSVVKIVCEDDDFFYYGSGTNIDPSGYIITNYHVIEGLTSDACMVGFPDPSSGLIKEAYWVHIITDADDETGHDLAYLAIDEPVFDVDGNLYGYYNKIADSLFPSFTHTDACLTSQNQLGDRILVLGYPLLSGEALTVTNGLISSLYSQNGYIITSAKIVNGNSGGLVINEDGCYIGVPTAVYYDNEEGSEVLGEIIDAEFVYEFDEAILDDLEIFYAENGIE